MDASTQTMNANAKVHFGMQTGEIGFWEQSEQFESMIKEVERSQNKRNTLKKKKNAKQSTGTQTAPPKNKGTQVFMWRLIPADIPENRRSNRERMEEFLQKCKNFDKVFEEMRTPEILSPIPDVAEENFKLPMPTEEWTRRKREDEKQERERYRKEIEKNGKQWTDWKIGEFHWEYEGKENERLNDNEDKKRRRKREDDSIKKEENLKKIKREANNRKNENIELKEKGTNIKKEEVNVETRQTENIELKKEDSNKNKSSEGNKNQKINEEDLKTLDGKKWLNDEVINRYFELILKKNQKTFAFGTFFFSRLISGGFSAVQRWTKKFNIFDFDLVLIPLHLGAHWCLATIDLKTKKIQYFDSLMGKNREYATIIFEYLIMEAANKKQSSFDPKQWSIVIKRDIPKQLNNFDCGVFVCSFAEYEASGREIDFCQKDMAAKRQKIIRSLIEGKLE
ncbi:sentrin-specific protease 1-like [Venturia canescens]|uniref:sentrin-specific protease 1-like n=1 Tax=Venturia canescens TaxID=32260 RepID=UPI001C9C7C82|nr:sentrin-specific protease 1-like [Venturia canescens]